LLIHTFKHLVYMHLFVLNAILGLRFQSRLVTVIYLVYILCGKQLKGHSCVRLMSVSKHVFNLC